MQATQQSAHDRFWSKVDNSGDCWNWTAGLRSGYGVFYYDGRSRQAHRVHYEWVNGPVPSNLVVDHICRNRRCVRPSHLRAITNHLNVISGDTIIAAQIVRNVCTYGHPLSGSNLHIDSRGYRVCRLCGARRAREIYARKLALATHCPRGHEYTPNNLLHTTRGRECRQCKNEAARPKRECSTCGALIASNHLARHLREIHGLKYDGKVWS